MKLTDTVCRTAKPKAKAYNLTDGAGLALQIRPAGGKLWLQDYKAGGKRNTASFGPYPNVTLAEAREKSRELKELIASGVDPRAIKAQAPIDNRATFEQVARDWFRTKESGWKTSYSLRIWSRVADDILPDLGKKAIEDIDPPTVLAVLRKIEGREAVYKARRLHQMTSQIFRFAIAGGIIKLNPAADLHVALKPIPKAKHRAALKEAELPAFLARVERYDGERQTAVAIKLVAHTFVRTAEIRLAKWGELEGDVWRIPAERMKMGREHLVPLTRQAKALFEELRSLAKGSEWMLPGPRTGQPISENTLLFAMYRMGYRSRATVHGLRATASTILNESEDPVWDRDGIEHQLAHAPDDAIRAAYNRGQRWEQRVRMMQWWSDRLDTHEKAGLVSDLSDLLD